MVVDLGVHTEHHPPRVGLLRLLADLDAGLDAVIHRFVECLVQGSHGAGVEADHVVDAREVPHEDIVFALDCLGPFCGLQGFNDRPSDDL